jgi:hypothetical protein
MIRIESERTGYSSGWQRGAARLVFSYGVRNGRQTPADIIVFNMGADIGYTKVTVEAINRTHLRLSTFLHHSRASARLGNCIPSGDKSESVSYFPKREGGTPRTPSESLGLVANWLYFSKTDATFAFGGNTDDSARCSVAHCAAHSQVCVGSV